MGSSVALAHARILASAALARNAVDGPALEAQTAPVNEDELARLAAAKLRLEDDWRRLPWWLTSAILVLPAFFAWGFEGALFVLLCVLAMVGTAAYLVRVAQRRVARALADRETGEANAKKGSVPLPRKREGRGEG
jgi:hypothetical protein